MKIIFNPELKANLSLDDSQHVRQINHFQEYWSTNQINPVLVATDYFHQVADLIQVPRDQLRNMHQQVSFLEPMKQGIEYRKSEEKTFFDSTTIGFYQTYLNVPVWQAGLTTTIKHTPYRVVSAVNTSQEGLNAKLPSVEAIDRYRGLFNQARVEQAKVEQLSSLQLGESEEESETAVFVRNLFDPDGVQGNSETNIRANQAVRVNNDRLIRGRFYVYKYDETQRLPETGQNSEGHTTPVLQLPSVDERIRNGTYYLVAEVTLSFTTQEYGHLNWLVLVELETGSVLYLRALADAVNGMIFQRDPITSTGNAANTPAQNNTVLNPFRSSVLLPNLNAPIGGVQSLRGSYANVINVEDPNITPPTSPTGTNFDYDVRTNNFAAVNAYYHVDNFFTAVASFGFPIATYFKNTTFPISVDHRDHIGGSVDAINAHCVGNGVGGIGHAGYDLGDLTDTTNPIGRACDSRVHWHELGGHGILYEHVNSANFGFSHSAGDSLSAIFHDPQTNAPDRFRYAPWNPINLRRFDRPVTSWAWGGSNDVGGYNSEEILATTLFRVYRSIGGDSADLGRRQFASRMMLYLILRAIGTLTPATNPSNAQGFANALMAVDLLNWTTEGIYGGAYNKVIRWSFEQQGLYQAPGAPTPVTTAGKPPAVDVYIDDGRGGEYPFQPVHWATTTIWNRRMADGGTTHQEPALTETNYAYVKIKNRGTQTANNVKVRGYHCRPSAGLLWPTELQAMTTAEISVGTLSGNNTEEKIIGPLQWTPVINAYGHDCMLMIVSADDDPSNIDNFTIGEVIPEWRLVPNDNNVGQRNVMPVPGGGGMEGLLRGLDGYSFWVGNPNLKTSTIELRVQLPEFLTATGWSMSFIGISNNLFELRSGKQQEVFMNLKPGKDFDKFQVEKAANTDIQISVFADDILIGGMNYRIDPDIKEPFNKKPGSQKPKCLDKAQELLNCLDIPRQDVKCIQIKKVTIDIEMNDSNCHCP
jgi:zinc metalloprotease ZmpB